ncbi:hypothetical protein DIPPA_29048 [Diplonema papillatum]|nr:hypothetical protein DIPPA_29048 [Diplonema papillatum]
MASPPGTPSPEVLRAVSFNSEVQLPYVSWNNIPEKWRSGFESIFKGKNAQVVFFFTLVQKVGHTVLPQERVVFVTHNAVYQCMPNAKVNRCVAIEDINDVLLSTEDNAEWVGLIVRKNNEYDLLFVMSSEQKRRFMHVLTTLFMHITGRDLKTKTLRPSDNIVKMLKLNKPKGWECKLQEGWKRKDALASSVRSASGGSSRGYSPYASSRYHPEELDSQTPSSARGTAKLRHPAELENPESCPANPPAAQSPLQPLAPFGNAFASAVSATSLTAIPTDHALPPASTTTQIDPQPPATPASTKHPDQPLSEPTPTPKPSPSAPMVRSRHPVEITSFLADSDNAYRQQLREIEAYKKQIGGGTPKQAPPSPPRSAGAERDPWAIPPVKAGFDASDTTSDDGGPASESNFLEVGDRASSISSTMSVSADEKGGSVTKAAARRSEHSPGDPIFACAAGGVWTPGFIVERPSRRSAAWKVTYDPPPTHPAADTETIPCGASDSDYLQVGPRGLSVSSSTQAPFTVDVPATSIRPRVAGLAVGSVVEATVDLYDESGCFLARQGATGTVERLPGGGPGSCASVSFDGRTVQVARRDIIPRGEPPHAPPAKFETGDEVEYFDTATDRWLPSCIIGREGDAYLLQSDSFDLLEVDLDRTPGAIRRRGPGAAWPDIRAAAPPPKKEPSPLPAPPSSPANNHLPAAPDPPPPRLRPRQANGGTRRDPQQQQLLQPSHTSAGSRTLDSVQSPPSPGEPAGHGRAAQPMLPKAAADAQQQQHTPSRLDSHHSLPSSSSSIQPYARGCKVDVATPPAQPHSAPTQVHLPPSVGNVSQPGDNPGVVPVVFANKVFEQYARQVAELQGILAAQTSPSKAHPHHAAAAGLTRHQQLSAELAKLEAAEGTIDGSPSASVAAIIQALLRESDQLTKALELAEREKDAKDQPPPPPPPPGRAQFLHMSPPRGPAGPAHGYSDALTKMTADEVSDLFAHKLLLQPFVVHAFARVTGEDLAAMDEADLARRIPRAPQAAAMVFEHLQSHYRRDPPDVGYVSWIIATRQQLIEDVVRAYEDVQSARTLLVSLKKLTKSHHNAAAAIDKAASAERSVHTVQKTLANIVCNRLLPKEKWNLGVAGHPSTHQQGAPVGILSAFEVSVLNKLAPAKGYQANELAEFAATAPVASHRSRSIPREARSEVSVHSAAHKVRGSSRGRSGSAGGVGSRKSSRSLKKRGAAAAAVSATEIKQREWLSGAHSCLRSPQPISAFGRTNSPSQQPLLQRSTSRSRTVTPPHGRSGRF